MLTGHAQCRTLRRSPPPKDRQRGQRSFEPRTDRSDDTSVLASHACVRTSAAVGILVRRLQEFREEMGEEWQSAPCILAETLNDQPHSATYHLLTGRELTQHCYDEVASSSVVHKSIDERREKGNVSNGFAPGTTEPAREAPANKAVPAMSEVFEVCRDRSSSRGRRRGCRRRRGGGRRGSGGG